MNSVLMVKKIPTARHTNTSAGDQIIVVSVSRIVAKLITFPIRDGADDVEDSVHYSASTLVMR